MSRSPEETYIQTYQKYLKHKGNSSDLLKPPSTASTKLLKPAPKPIECKICTVLAKPLDLAKVLNQGLYHKYTSSQDYFYTRDINSLLCRKRKPFCVRYNDDMIFDECKERLKGYFKKKDSQSLMTEIKDFYTKFKNFPRNFHPHFSSIINSNIRKHRRLEYIKVFNNPNFDESRPPGEDGEAVDNGQFNFMELLGTSFLQDNYKDLSGIVIGDVPLGKNKESESSMREVAANFRALYSVPPNLINDPSAEPFSNAMYNKNYMLYSRSDSTTAEDILKQIVNEFHEGDLNKKGSMTLAERVMQQTSTNPKNSRKQENRHPPLLKQRTQEGLEGSSMLKKSLGSNASGLMTSSLLQKQSSQPPNTTSQRGGTPNPRSNPQIDTTDNILGKLSQNASGKFSVENLNEIVINRNKILSKLYQFRSTRSKSGGLKSSGSTTTTSKTPSSIRRRPMGLNCDTQGFDSVDSKQIQTAYYTTEKSNSQSPERRLSREKSSGGIETLTRQKSGTGIDSPYYSSVFPRSTSHGRNGDMREMASPLHPNRTRSSPQKKGMNTSTSAVRRSLATPKKQSIGPMMQNFIVLDGIGNNSGDNSAHNISQNNENPNPHPGSPTMGGRFINPMRASMGGTQMYYFRHQSPLEERMGQVSGVMHKVRSEARMKNLNIRALKNGNGNGSPKRVGTMSMSRRQQTMLDLSQAVNSFACPQTSVQMTSAGHISKSRNLRKSDAQLVGSKVSKRSSIVQHQVISGVEEGEEREKKGKKIALELSSGNGTHYKDLRLPSKEHTPSNYFPASATSFQKLKSEMKKSGIASYSLKGHPKDIKFGIKK